MPLPKYDELYNPILTLLQDGNIHTMKELRDGIAAALRLSEDDLSSLLPSGRQTVISNRIGWASTYLKKAELIVSPQRAHFQITDEGKQLLKSNVLITDDLLAQRYPAFAAFKYGKADGADASENPDASGQILPTNSASETPMETLERVYTAINEQLADELLSEIMNQSPTFFEKLVVDLMTTMNYGNGFVTKASNDGGIDGIIHEDKLGFNLIYVQAKRWDLETSIGRPEVQKFAGAMMGPPKVEKGLFITTAKFSPSAKTYAKAQHIILVDGRRLAALMIEYGLGVSTQRTYSIKHIDSDYFADN